MCGIFGHISLSRVNRENIKKIVKYSGQRGMDSSGLIYLENSIYKVCRANYKIEKLLQEVKPYESKIVLGHSRLITNGLLDNQPVVRNNICVIHNGIIVNDEDVWKKTGLERKYQIDSEVIVAITEEHLLQNGELSDLPHKVFSICEGIIACALIIPNKGKILLFSNNGSLYVGENETDFYFASERFPLVGIGCVNIKQVKEVFFIDIPVSQNNIIIKDNSSRSEDLIPKLKYNKSENSLLEYQTPDLKRCTCCILPETMPFINFDSNGVCNYCRNYKLRNIPKPKEELFNIVEPYRCKNGNDCIVPFSGGRDSSYGLHLIVNELKMKPVTYTYDWGMITDLGRRNISRICAKLGIENIIVAANISRKRKNIAMNLKAWLKHPHLGMVSVLTAGDKHFFKYIEKVKSQTLISLNLWGINPLEVTHFKAGFLGVKPDFEEKKVYSNGIYKQLRYQYFRFKAMLESPSYFNCSLWDTLSGEYYRSFTEKSDYYHIFDYWSWNEKIIEDTLDSYNWERALDTNTTWRIGDGTAAFYNYIYYTVTGFTEHDTFRSNQIREGDMVREKALELVKDENRPRYSNIRWYLDVLGFDFNSTIKRINEIPKLYK